MATEIDLRVYKLKTLPVVPIKDAILFIKDTEETTIELYVTNSNGTPFPLVSVSNVITVTGTGVTGTPLNRVVDISHFVSSDADNGLILSNNDGKLFVSLPESSDTITVEGVGDSYTLDIDQTILNTINSALQSVDLGYTPSATNGVVTNSAGADATIPSVTDTEAGLMLPAQKSKLDGIQAGAEVNVQSDWDAVSGDSFIQNKPTTFPPSSHTHVISDVTGLQTELDGKVDENVAIVGATKTKITYDNKGLVTTGADATTADINDSIDRRYVTDAEKTVIGNTSNTNTGDQDLSGLVVANTAITGATKTKITYDSKGLVTSGADATTADIGEDSNYLYFTTARVLATLLTGLSLATGGAIVSTDTVLEAFGKIQKQINDLSTVYQAILVSGTNIKTFAGISLLGSGDAAVPQDTLTTAASITTATVTDGGYSQGGRNIVIKNAATAINIECLGGQPRTYQKGEGSTGAITFIAGVSPARTLVQVSGTNVLNGVAGSIASLTSDGTVDYLIITNF